MLLGANNELENLITKYLAGRGGIKVPEIQKHLEKKEEPTTVQGIYRVLRKLQKEGVVAKSGQYYSLRLPWILELHSLGEKMESVYFGENYLQSLVPQKDGEKKIWYFSDLVSMNNFWAQLLIVMAKVSKSKIMLDYSPHGWFHIATPIQEYQHLKSLLKNLKGFYEIIGSRSFLDEWTERYYNFSNLHYSLVHSNFSPIKDKNRYINVSDDWIMTVYLSNKTAELVEKFYQQIKEENDLKKIDPLKLFTKRCKVKIVFEKNKKKAGAFRKKYKRFFGPLR